MTSVAKPHQSRSVGDHPDEIGMTAGVGEIGRIGLAPATARLKPLQLSLRIGAAANECGHAMAGGKVTGASRRIAPHGVATMSRF
jgi:hypothetical protein